MRPHSLIYQKMSNINDPSSFKRILEDSERELDTYIPNQEKEDYDLEHGIQNPKTQKKKIRNEKESTSAGSAHSALNNHNEEHSVELSIDDFKRMIRDALVSTKKREGTLPKSLSVSNRKRLEEPENCPVKGCRGKVAFQISATLKTRGTNETQRITNMLLHLVKKHPTRRFPKGISAQTLLNMLTDSNTPKKTTRTTRTKKKTPSKKTISKKTKKKSGDTE